ncbi:2-polyprenyl-6-methoxyphenol hydroxylase-like FAD-dependent oxidoreductase [Crossiella equi]|uniref:2-polyprenyl-6-methoxyphenol hydroxylase-like FAD-dependent oxidoreductase n=1 Tax=Crossiella equi TaxID=130796 RepID=A0ABS5AJP7_9PSEU|nr:FAD-dependent monooxygenase [Crossiella equi]MBP2476798.1 2-polyprenyl-6-methoxyphenol hydroxylase-like FAD-dependent oxidoreductase [Crossiella equi]
MSLPVIVVGAGPTGLMLACELTVHGAEVLVLERLTEPSRGIKAGGINTRTLDTLARHGLAAEVRGRVHANVDRYLATLREQNPGLAPDYRPPAFGGHFAGLAVLDASRLDHTDPDLTPSSAEGMQMLMQQEVEEILGDWAARLGVRIRRGVELTGLDQDSGGVTATLADGTEVRGSYLVGCDGGRSLVRKKSGFAFPGTGPTTTAYQAIVDLDRPGELSLSWQHLPGGTLVYGPAPGRVLTVEYDGPPADRDAPVTAEELTRALRRVSGTEVTVTKVHSATRFTDNARVVPDYRTGRVLLAGDAAHVHAPFGGQGLNLGVQDAANLGWKLAAVARGQAPESLLETYTAERRPAAELVLRMTRAQVAAMRPDPHAAALRETLTEVMATADGNQYFTKFCAGQLVRYEQGDGHRLVGRFAQPLGLPAHAGWTLAELVPDTARAALVGERVRVFPAVQEDDPELAAVLIRPDGYVAWAADRSDPDHSGLAAALGRWAV